MRIEVHFCRNHRSRGCGGCGMGASNGEQATPSRETYRAEKRTEASQLYAHKVGYDDAWRDARRFVEKTAGALRRCDKPPILLSDSVPRMPSLGYASRCISRMSTAGGYRGLSKGLQSLLDHVVF
jgi:hypothetical protein